jgi:hypothetical protein
MLDLTNNTWDFAVEEHPLEVNGKVIDGWKALVNGTTGDPLYVHRNSYKVLTHSDVVNATWDAVKQANLSNDFDFEVTSLEDGRKLKVDVLFNDLVAEPAVGDHVKFRIRAFNSYDGAWSYNSQADALRLWCLNGCVNADMLARINSRHTANVSIEGTAAYISRSLETFKNEKDMWQSYMKRKVTSDAAEELFRTRLVREHTKTTEEKFNKRQLENLMGHWQDNSRELGPNKWALYNAMTAWSTHTTGKAPHNTQRQREQLVASALASKAWELV